MNIFVWLAVALLVANLIFFIYAMRKWPGWGRKLLALGLSLLVTLGGLWLLLFPPSSPVATTGPRQVKEVDRWFSRATSDPGLETQDGKREIPARISYPDGPADAQRRLLVFSHGSFGTNSSNESLYRELASHGWVVVSLAHPRQSFTAKLSNGKSVYVDPSFVQSVQELQSEKDLKARNDAAANWLKVRDADMTAALDAIKANPDGWPELQHLDTQRIVLAGHSLGGSSALSLGRSRPDVQAVVALEAPYFGDIRSATSNSFTFDEAAYPKPVLHFYSSHVWSELNKVESTQAEEYRRNVENIKNPGDKFVNVPLEKIGHVGMTDLARVSPVLTSFLDGGQDNADPADTLRRINAETLKFLDAKAR